MSALHYGLCYSSIPVVVLNNVLYTQLKQWQEGKSSDSPFSFVFLESLALSLGIHSLTSSDPKNMTQIFLVGIRYMWRMFCINDDLLHTPYYSPLSAPNAMVNAYGSPYFLGKPQRAPFGISVLVAYVCWLTAHQHCISEEWDVKVFFMKPDTNLKNDIGTHRY